MATSSPAVLAPPAKSQSERTARQLSLYILGFGFTATAALMTRRAVRRRRVAAVPQFFPSDARWKLLPRLHAEAVRAATTTTTTTTTVTTAAAAPTGGMRALLPGFLGGYKSSAGQSTVAASDAVAEQTAAKQTADTAALNTHTSPPPALSPDNPAELTTLLLAGMAGSLDAQLARKRADSGGLAAEALVLATFNVVALALLCAGAFGVVFDVADVDDLRDYARRNVLSKRGSGNPADDEKAERELEEMAKEFLDKFGIAAGGKGGEDKETKADA